MIHAKTLRSLQSQTSLERTQKKLVNRCLFDHSDCIFQLAFHANDLCQSPRVQIGTKYLNWTAFESANGNANIRIEAHMLRHNFGLREAQHGLAKRTIYNGSPWPVVFEEVAVAAYFRHTPWLLPSCRLPVAKVLEPETSWATSWCMDSLASHSTRPCQQPNVLRLNCHSPCRCQQALCQLVFVVLCLLYPSPSEVSAKPRPWTHNDEQIRVQYMLRR